MQKMIFIVLGLVLLFSFGCPGEESPPAAPVEEEAPADGGGFIDCGTDLDCFVTASENCTPAKVQRTLNFSIFGMITIADVSMEIRGMENGSCVFYQIITNQGMMLSEEMKEMMRESGATEAEIEETEQKGNANAQKGIGTETICRTSAERLNAVMNMLKEGNLGAGFEEDECEITYPPALMEMLEQPEPEEMPPEQPEVEETEEEPEMEIVPAEPVEEIACVPIATSGYAEIGMYTKDAKYFYEGTEVAYASHLEVGESFGSGDAVISLEEIIINGTCEECGEKPSWTYAQLVKIKITVAHGEDEVRVVGVDEHGSFISSYKCKTLDWDGKTCIEYVPDESNQYYVWRVVADKICVPE